MALLGFSAAMAISATFTGMILCLWRLLPISRNLFGLSKKGNFDTLPDGVIAKILSELPVDQILRCRRTCRRWRHIIDEPQFAEAHPGKEPSTTVFQSIRPYTSSWVGGDDEFGLYLIRPRHTKKWAPTDIKRMTLRRVGVPDDEINPPIIRGSCNGLIIFGGLYHPPRYFICNPVTQESAKLEESLVDFVCGFYFHPSREEYRLIMCAESGKRTETDHQFRYYTCDLRGKFRKELGAYPYGPRTGVLCPAPVLARGFLYYMMRNFDRAVVNHGPTIIMALDLETEEVKFIPHPRGQGHFQMECKYLLETEGRLCLFCQKTFYDTMFEIWSLEDRASQSWIRRISVVQRVGNEVQGCQLQPLMIKRDGDLILNWERWGLIGYSIQTTKFAEIIRLPTTYPCGDRFSCFPMATCKMSLTSLSSLRL